MGRLSATMTRMWQAMMDMAQGRVQTYMDDPLVALHHVSSVWTQPLLREGFQGHQSDMDRHHAGNRPGVKENRAGHPEETDG